MTGLYAAYRERGAGLRGEELGGRLCRPLVVGPGERLPGGGPRSSFRRRRAPTSRRDPLRRRGVARRPGSPLRPAARPLTGGAGRPPLAAANHVAPVPPRDRWAGDEL